MKKILFWSGRTLQLVGLLILPSAIWVTEVQRNEALAVGLLVSSVVLFFVGWILAR